MKTRNIIILAVILAALAGIYYAVSRPEAEDAAEPANYIWQIEMSAIERIEIQLPREGRGQSFIKITEGEWYFDDGPHSEIDPDRWGSGITLLLSGPGSDRVITEDATASQLAEYGLDEPAMTITLDLADGSRLIIDLGDATIDGSARYVRAPGTSAVATVYSGWYQIIERLVTDPPYAAAGE